MSETRELCVETELCVHGIMENESAAHSGLTLHRSRETNMRDSGVGPIFFLHFASQPAPCAYVDVRISP
jgi:hypothetical protein